MQNCLGESGHTHYTNFLWRNVVRVLAHERKKIPLTIRDRSFTESEECF